MVLVCSTNMHEDVDEEHAKVNVTAMGVMNDIPPYPCYGCVVAYSRCGGRTKLASFVFVAGNSEK